MKERTQFLKFSSTQSLSSKNSTWLETHWRTKESLLLWEDFKSTRNCPTFLLKTTSLETRNLSCKPFTKPGQRTRLLESTTLNTMRFKTKESRNLHLLWKSATGSSTCKSQKEWAMRWLLLSRRGWRTTSLRKRRREARRRRRSNVN